MTKRIYLAVLPILALTAYACSSTPTTNTSTLQGTLAAEGFPSAPTAIVAVDEAKTETTAAIATDGSFSLVLAKNHHYSMHAKLDTGDVPVVFPRADGTLDSGISITSGAAKFDMGALRYAGGAPAGSFALLSTADAVAGQTCYGGMDMRMTAVCVQTTTTVSCQYGPEEEEHHCDHDGDQDGDQHGDHQDEDAAFAAQDAALQAADVPVDATNPMVVPEKSIPDSVGGCDDGDEEDEEEDDDD